MSGIDYPLMKFTQTFDTVADMHAAIREAREAAQSIPNQRLIQVQRAPVTSGGNIVGWSATLVYQFVPPTEVTP